MIKAKNVTFFLSTLSSHGLVNSFPARSAYMHSFGLLCWKPPQESEKILSDLVEQRWRVRKLKSSPFQNVIAHRMSIFWSQTTTLSNLAIGLDAWHPRLYCKKYRDTVYRKIVVMFRGVGFFDLLIAVRFSSLFFCAKGTHTNPRNYVK